MTSRVVVLFSLRGSANYSSDQVESEVSSYWEESDAYRQAKKAHEDDENYYFLDGPPYTNGQIHVGHAWNKTLKDAMIRYKRMQGYKVTDRPGYDMHGLPIEVKVEEELGFETKQEIDEFGLDNFTEKCREFAETTRREMDEDFADFGVWMDWDNPYKTLSNDYMETAWWAFKKAYERGLVERGKRVVNQCPRCATPIANAEVEYEEVESPSVYAKFPFLDGEGYLVVWTTTPWTFPANLYVAVDEEAEYSKVLAQKDGEKEVLYLASDCVENVLKEARYQEYEVLETFEGEELVGLEYEHPLLDEVPRQKELSENPDVHRVYATDFVTTERTGLVHSAPGHGMEDFEFARDSSHDLPVFSPVDGEGVYTDEGGRYSGKFVRDANPDVVDDLRENDLLLAEGTHEHRYGHCWRCDTPIVFVATDQWFMSVVPVKGQIKEELKKSEWHPDWARDSRFWNWVDDARDWCVSRQRYWGTPIPVWECENGHNTCVGSREELQEKALEKLDVDELDLHRPGVDPVELECDECGEPAQRVEDIFDVWFDSAVASFASLDYPQEEEGYEDFWPADLIIEAHDQTRGWFWSQLATSVAVTGKTPYKEVAMYGHALMSDGSEMSKSTGNIVSPQEVMDEYGAEPLRLYLLDHTPDGEDMKFSTEGVEEMERKLNVVWNTFKFPLPYMELDDFDPENTGVEDVDLNEVDRWVLSRLQSVKRKMVDRMDEVDTEKALRALLDFLTEDVSRFYVQVVRPRMWEEENSEEKQAAYATLYRVLEESARMLAPFAPYLSEVMYHLLDGEKTTVHELYWPEVEEELVDEELEENLEVVRQVEEAGANARQKADRKLRWPVKKVVVRTQNDGVERAVRELDSLLLDRLNAKSVEVVRGEWEESSWRVVPQMDVLGPKYGEKAGNLKTELEEMTRDELENLGYEVELDGKNFELTEEMVEYAEELPENVESAEFSGGVVYVDASLDEELESEGYSREVVRRVQEMRKELDLDVEERIRVAVELDDDRVADLLDLEYVAEEVRADEVVESMADLDEPLVRDWDVEGVELRLGVETLGKSKAEYEEETEEKETEALD